MIKKKKEMELSGICQLQRKKQLLDTCKSDAVYHALIKVFVEPHLEKQKTNKNNNNKTHQNKTTTKNNNTKPNPF